MQADGSVSWLLNSNAKKAPRGPNFSHYEFEHIFHQIRNPIKVISSYYNFPPPEGWKWISPRSTLNHTIELQVVLLKFNDQGGHKVAAAEVGIDYAKASDQDWRRPCIIG